MKQLRGNYKFTEFSKGLTFAEKGFQEEYFITQ